MVSSGLWVGVSRNGCICCFLGRSGFLGSVRILLSNTYFAYFDLALFQVIYLVNFFYHISYAFYHVYEHIFGKKY